MTGDGARLFGGRWNSKGAPVIYAASSLALACMEIMAGLKDYAALRDTYAAIAVHIPKRLVEHLEPALLPADWIKPEHPAPKGLGDQWIKDRRSAVLLVPSAVVPLEHNLLINPLHMDFRTINVGEPQSFDFDPRLIKAADPAD